MLLKPLCGESCDLFEGPGLCEEMRSARHNAQGFLALQLGIGRFVELDHHVITAADDEQRWCQHLGEESPGEIRPPAAGDHRTDDLTKPGSGHERSAPACTGTEVPDAHILCASQRSHGGDVSI